MALEFFQYDRGKVQTTGKPYLTNGVSKHPVYAAQQGASFTVHAVGGDQAMASGDWVVYDPSNSQVSGVTAANFATGFTAT